MFSAAKGNEFSHRSFKSGLFYPRQNPASRKIATWHFKEIPGAVEFGEKINRTESIEALRELIQNFKVDENPQNKNWFFPFI